MLCLPETYDKKRHNTSIFVSNLTSKDTANLKLEHIRSSDVQLSSRRWRRDTHKLKYIGESNTDGLFQSTYGTILTSRSDDDVAPEKPGKLR